MKHWMYSAVCLLVVTLMVEGAPVEEAKRVKRDEPSARDYLGQYGYLGEQNSEVAAIMSEDPFVHALKKFQQIAHIPITGVMDKATENMMAMPRCGVPDQTRMGESGKRKKRYLLEGKRPTSEKSCVVKRKNTPAPAYY